MIPLRLIDANNYIRAKNKVAINWNCNILYSISRAHLYVVNDSCNLFQVICYSVIPNDKDLKMINGAVQSGYLDLNQSLCYDWNQGIPF